MSSDPSKLADVQAFFGGMAKNLEKSMKDMPAGVDRDFNQGVLNGFRHLEGMARNGTDRGITAFLSDSGRTSTVGLGPKTAQSILESYESYRIGMLSPDEYADQIKKGMAPDLETKRALFNGVSSRVAAGEQEANEQARKRNADVRAQLGGAKPDGPPQGGKPPAGALPADAQAALDKQAGAARADLAKLGHTYATPGDGPSVTTIMHGAKKDTRAALDALKPQKSGGLTGILNSLGEMKRPKGGGTAVVIMTGLIGAASLLGHKPAEAAPPKVESTVKEGPATVNKTKPSGP